MPRSRLAWRAASLVKYGCTSIWLTAGVTSASFSSMARWSGWKLLTPIERVRPSALNSCSTFHVDT